MITYLLLELRWEIKTRYLLLTFFFFFFLNTDQVLKIIFITRNGWETARSPRLCIESFSTDTFPKVEKFSILLPEQLLLLLRFSKWMRKVITFFGKAQKSMSLCSEEQSKGFFWQKESSCLKQVIKIFLYIFFSKFFLTRIFRTQHHHFCSAPMVLQSSSTFEPKFIGRLWKRWWGCCQARCTQRSVTFFFYSNELEAHKFLGTGLFFLWGTLVEVSSLNPGADVSVFWVFLFDSEILILFLG